MPKYLVRASFTQDGIRGTLKEGGTARKEVVERLAPATVSASPWWSRTGRASAA